MTTPHVPIAERRPGETVPMWVVARESLSGDRYWFTPDTLRAWSCRLPDRATIGRDGRAYFVSSEQDRAHFVNVAAWNGERRYTIRAFDPITARVHDAEPDGFTRYATRAEATRAMRAILAAL